MDHALKRGLTAHRDIKPENLLINREGDLQITDFGLSASATGGLARAGEVSGTPFYMAPEQWLGRPQDFRTDAYSFGLVLYEICFGRLPWNATTLEELRRECLATDYPDTPAGHPFNVIIPIMTARQPENRAESPAVMREATSWAAQIIGAKLPAPAVSLNQEQEELLAEASLSLVGEKDRALLAARKLTKKWPNFAAGWTQLGRLLYSANELREAGFASQRAVDLDPGRTAPWNNLGLIFHRAGHHQQAVGLFKNALDCDPGNSGAMINLSGPLSELGRVPEAIEYLERAVKLAPDKLSGWINLGSLLNNSGQTKRAHGCFVRVLDCVADKDRANVVKTIQRVAPSFRI